LIKRLPHLLKKSTEQPTLEQALVIDFGLSAMERNFIHLLRASVSLNLFASADNLGIINRN
jgi:hypothetical protein